MRFKFHSNNYRNNPARNEKFVRKVNHKCIYMFRIENCGTLRVKDMVKERKFGVISDTFQADILFMKTKLNYTTIINL
jgi:transposase